MNNGNLKLSFGFAKSKKAQKVSHSSKFTEDDNVAFTTPDYLTSFENHEPQSLLVSKKEELIIPLKISRTNIREQLKRKYVKVEPGDDLTDEALKLLTSGEPIEKEEFLYGKQNIVVVPPTDQSSSEIAEADYDQIPIEKFGLALLKGMGLKEEEVKGPASGDFEAMVRLKGLGLGADPNVLKKLRESAKNRTPANSEKLVFKQGAKCQVVFGRHEGLYGIIQGLDGDTGRAIVKLASDKQIIKVMQATIRLVCTDEYDKFRNYLNHAKAEKYKKQEIVLDDNQSLSKKRPKLEDPLETTPPSRSVEKEPTWLKKGLFVRYVNKENKHYLQEVKIMSVSSCDCRCTCLTRKGKTLKDIRENELQTIVPKDSGALVVVVRGYYKGEIGKLVERTERSSRAEVWLRSIDKKISLNFDDICTFEF